MDFSGFYQRHPIATWVLGIGAMLVIIWALFSRAGASAGTVEAGTQVITTSGVSDAALATSASLEAARIAAAADARRADNELLLGQATLAVEQAKASYERDTSQKTLDVQNNLGMYSIASSERVSIAGLQADTDQFSMTAELEKYRIGAEAAQEISRTQAQTEQARILGNTQLMIAQTQTDAQKAATAANASVAKKQSTNGLIGSIASIGAAIFSDDRLKQNAVPIGVRDDGLMVWEYEYTPAARARFGLPAGRQQGVMASQVIAAGKNHAVTYKGGFRQVDYARI